MKKNLFLAAGLIIACFTQAQTFWTETFGTGCNQLQSAIGFNSGNGAWAVTATGTNAAEGNKFYVSAEENGNAVGACGTGCGTNATLHVGNVSTSPSAGFFCPTGDCGAAYDAGGGCGFGLGCVSTDLRAESPTINCTGQTGITITFKYMEGGQNTADNATLWYFDGATWTQIDNIAKSVNTGCSGQGKWTAFTLALPASANNNANVKIGFRWVNNDDGNGTDPSFAVDDVALSVSASPTVPVVTITPVGSTTVCANASITLNGSATNGPITGWQWTSNPSAGVSYSPSSTSQNVNVSFTTAGNYTFTLTATNASGNGSTTQTVTVNANNAVSVAVSSTPATPVCEGTPIAFQATPTNGGAVPTYTWFENGVQMQSNTFPLYNTTANNNDTIIVQMTPFGITCPLPATAVDTFVIQTNAPVTPAVAITANPATFCAGTNVTFTANPTNGGSSPGYIWTLNGFPVSAVDTFASASLNDGDTLIVNMLSNQTCVTGNTASDTFAIQVIPSPNLTLAQDSVSVCPGAPASLIANATAGSTFLWSPGTDLNSTTNDTVIATISSNGFYTYTVTATLGSCMQTDSVVVEVTNNLTTSITGSTSVCLGDSTQLSAANGTAWSWSPAAGLSCTNCQNPMASPSSTTTYSVDVSSGTCNASATFTLTVNSTPTSVSLGSVPATPVCEGSQIVIQATPTNGGSLPLYTWFENGVQVQSNNLPAYTATANNNDTIIVQMTSNAANCPVPAVAVDTFIIQTTAPVTPSVAITPNPATFCAGTNVTFTANPTNGGASPAYAWFLNNFPVGVITDTYSSSTLADGDTIIVNMLSNLSCVTNNTASDTFVVQLLPSPNLTIIQGSTTVCPGSSATLIAGAAAGSSFSWSPATDLDTTTNDTVIATISTLGTYTYTVTSTLGTCTESQSVTVTVSNTLTANITGPTSVCEGSSAQLNVNGGNTWSWSPAAGLSCTNCQNPLATPTASTEYTVNVTSGSCTASATHSITVNTEPTVSVPPISICNGNSGQLNATGGATWQWIPSTGLSCTNCANPTANPAVTTIYAVVGTDANGCDDTTSVTVTVTSPPTIAVVQGNTTFCPGGSDTLVVSADAGSTYSWAPATGLNTTSDDSAVVSLSNLGVTQYTVTAALNGCSSQQTIDVTVANTLTVSVNQIGLCLGDSAQLIATGGTSWTWAPATGLSCTNCQSPYASNTVTTTYTVTATQGACVASTSTIVGVAPYANAAYTYSQPNGGLPQTVTFDNTSTNASGYTWLFGDGSTSSATDPVHVYTEEGTYQVTLIAANAVGCGPDTISYTLVILDGSLVIVPNIFTPNGDQTNETLDIQTKGISDLVCTIYDRWGLKIAEVNGINNPKWDGKTASGNAAAEGTYFYILKATGIDNKTFDMSGSVLLIK
jgi:gliding motility-associated-like protein